jgi:cytochrome c biogenesis protein
LTTTDRSPLQSLWDFFCSLKLSISLLILLALTSIIGTIIPQGPEREYLMSLSPAKLKLYSALGFFDMYHSWWFILLLYLLTVNLIACSVKRLPRVWKIVREPALILDSGLEKSLSLTHESRLSLSQAAAQDKLTAFLSGKFAPPVVTEQDGEVHLFAQKQPWSRLGVYVVHTSIIIIFIGAIIGSLFGYKAFVNIPEGGSTSVVFKRSGEEIPLGFTVRCEDFSVSFYDTGAPKEFKSILTVEENGKPVIEKRSIVVNDPLSYKGITFYQSSYGQAGEGGTFHFSVRQRSGGAPVMVAVRQGESAKLPDGSTMHVLEATQDVRSFIPQFQGPAVRIEVHSPAGKTEAFIVFSQQYYPDLDAQRGGDLIFNFVKADEKMFTGLQVAKDPGVWVVWLGCTLMVLGCMMAFFMSHKRVWIRIEKGRAVMAGTASKNPAGFDLQFHALLDELKKLEL